MKIFKNGKFHSFNSENTVYEALVVENEKIIFTGSTNEVLKKYGEKAEEIVDFEGKTIVPGFNDSHVHFMNYGYTEKKVKLHHCKTIAELIELGKKAQPYGGWILGRGWNQDLFLEENGIPEKKDLDQISTTIPVCYTRTCGHVLVVNSKAMEVCGITRDTKCFGGEIDYDKGLFTENALELIYSHIDPLSVEELKEIILDTTDKFLAMGITSVQTDDFSSFPDKDFMKIVRAYEELKKEGKLKVRVYEQCFMDTVERVKELYESGLTPNKGDELFKIGPIKMLLDGSLGGKTALMLEAYEGEESNRGVVC